MKRRALIVLALSALLVLLAGCRYTPWEAESDCHDRYETNLAWLADMDARRPDRERFTVALLADIHEHLDTLETVVGRINANPDVSFVLVLGDLTSDGLAQSFEWACRALRKLRVPRLYVIGNHDAIAFGKEIFQDAFGPFDYAFDFAGTRFVLYNDNAYEFPGAPDYGFLARAAALAPGETRAHTIGVSHPPPITDVHPPAEAEALRAFLADAGYELTVHGHRHRANFWTDDDGVAHYVTGAALDGAYSLMTVEREGGITLQACTNVCQPYGSVP